MWQYLVDKGLNDKNYVLKVDAPTKSGRETVFLELEIAFEDGEDRDMEANKTICEHLFLQMHKELVIINKAG